MVVPQPRRCKPVARQFVKPEVLLGTPITMQSEAKRKMGSKMSANETRLSGNHSCANWHFHTCSASNNYVD